MALPMVVVCPRAIVRTKFLNNGSAAAEVGVKVVAAAAM